MEQRDYLLREIEKFGLLIKAILNKLHLIRDNSSIALEKQFDETCELLLNDAEFNLKEFLWIDESEIEQYLQKHNAIRGSNIELLADLLKTMGVKNLTGNRSKILGKALKLYEICNLQDKTYSADRENKIEFLKNLLKN